MDFNGILLGFWRSWGFFIPGGTSIVVWQSAKWRFVCRAGDSVGFWSRGCCQQRHLLSMSGLVRRLDTILPAPQNPQFLCEALTSAPRAIPGLCVAIAARMRTRNTRSAEWWCCRRELSQAGRMEKMTDPQFVGPRSHDSEKSSVSSSRGDGDAVPLVCFSQLRANWRIKSDSSTWRIRKEGRLGPIP